MQVCRAHPSRHTTRCSRIRTWKARDFFWDAPHPTIGGVRQVGSPMRFSRTPVTRRVAGPPLAAQRNLCLQNWPPAAPGRAMSDDIVVAQRGPVLSVTFNRPAQRNAMTFGMYEGLVAACDRADGDPQIRVVVLRGAGGQAFVAAPTSPSSLSSTAPAALSTNTRSTSRSADCSTSRSRSSPPSTASASAAASRSQPLPTYESPRPVPNSASPSHAPSETRCPRKALHLHCGTSVTPARWT